MTLLQDFRRVTKQEQSRVSHYPHGCLVSKIRDASVASATCQRTGSVCPLGDAWRLGTSFGPPTAGALQP